MKTYLFTFFLSALLSCSAFASEGIISVESDYSAQETADRFASIIEAKGLTLFARIDHRENAKTAKHEMRPTEVFIFGNPKVGTPLMLCAQSIAIDLPQKALIWEDQSGTVWFSYNDPRYLQQRHSMDGCDKIIDKISSILDQLSKAASKK